MEDSISSISSFSIEFDGPGDWLTFSTCKGSSTRSAFYTLIFIGSLEDRISSNSVLSSFLISFCSLFRTIFSDWIFIKFRGLRPGFPRPLLGLSIFCCKFYCDKLGLILPRFLASFLIPTRLPGIILSTRSSSFSNSPRL